jgi:tetratricopeptide (TPR) repeat protein
VQAYTLYLKGLYQWNKRTNDAMRKAITLFEEALVQDPEYAPAYAGIADCYGLLGWVAFGALPPHEAFPRAEAAARRALELDDSLAEAHNTLGWTRLVYGWDWRDAETRFLRAIELNPRYAMAHSWYALHLTWTHRHEEAVLAAERAMALDPLSLIIYTLAGWIHYFRGRYDRSVELYERALELAPDYVRAHLGLGWALEEQGKLDAAIDHFRRGATVAEDSPRYVAALGHAYALADRHEDAREQLARLEALSGSMFVSPSYVASVYAGLKDADQTFRWLEKAFEARSGALVYLGQDPQFKHLRTDPRFGALLSRVGFPAG